MSHPDLNLARKPFINTRPIGRVAVLLWILGGALLLFNAILYWGFFTSSEERRDALAQTQGRIDAHQAAIADLRDQLDGLNLPQQNAQVLFLNRKIAERTFGWSRLFDDLEEVMPDKVRLINLAPVTDSKEVSRSAAGPDSGEVVRLQIDCVARDGDAQLEFIDRLFADPLFSAPRLSSDAVDAAGLIRFNLTVDYYPKTSPATAATPAAAEDTAPEDPPAEETGTAAEGEET